MPEIQFCAAPKPIIHVLLYSEKVLVLSVQKVAFEIQKVLLFVPKGAEDSPEPTPFPQ